MLESLLPLFLDLNLGFDPARVGAWTVPLIGLAAAGLSFVVGFAVLGRRKRQLPAARGAGTEETVEPADPFVQGSKSERRAAHRREGAMVPVLVTDADAQDPPEPGWVADRSVGGLCLRLTEAAPLGSVLSVRPRHATAVVPWTQVEVKSCRQEGEAWEVGCQFVRTPPWSVLLLFG